MKPCCSAFVIASIRARIPQSIQMKKLLSLTKIAFECPVLVYFCLLANCCIRQVGQASATSGTEDKERKKEVRGILKLAAVVSPNTKVDLFMFSEVSNLQKYLERISISSIR